MSIEDHLRAATRAEADRIEPDPGAWAAVQARVAARRVARRRATALAAAAAVGAVALGIGLLADRDGGDRVVRAGPGDTSTTTTTATTTPPDDATHLLDAVWPFTTLDQLTTHLAAQPAGTDPGAEATALAFAAAYVGLPDPKVVGPVVPAAGATGRSFEVTVQPRPGSPLRTTIALREVGGPESWIRLPDGSRLDDRPVYLVTGASTPNILLDEAGVTRDRPGGAASVHVTGTSTAFEATVDLEVRGGRQGVGERLAGTFVMGGANGEMGPFSGRVTVPSPDGFVTLVVVLSTTSAEDVTVQEATIRAFHPLDWSDG
ncbi:MAG: Gmad2 immunoglobulin-like domain-containing protein [Acidimicrobiia bacterium]